MMGFLYSHRESGQCSGTINDTILYVALWPSQSYHQEAVGVVKAMENDGPANSL